MAAHAELLSAATVGAWLAEQGLVEPGTPVAATELDWGVSNVVLAVEADGLHAVVKQALPRLRVADEWLAKRERSLTEARALALAGKIIPGAVPDVLAVDDAACAFATALAPPGWKNWKELLLAGTVDAAVAARVGTLLGTFHQETQDADIRRRFDDQEAFDQLRVDPYHRTVMRRWPRLEQAIGALIEEMHDRRLCLAHGDFSPKNILVGEDGVWLIDFEVVHAGDPAFDLGFLQNHLMLKAIHRPDGFERYEDAASRFFEDYAAAVRWPLTPDEAYVALHAGCLMLARVDGKSPAEYLTEPERLVARAVGTRLVLDPPDSLSAMWQRLGEALR